MTIKILKQSFYHMRDRWNKTERKDINTSAIINKSKVFRDVTLNLSKCRAAMISILQALSMGAQFSEKEQEELFFSLTQLFHSSDVYVHRLLILLLKQIPVNSHNAIIITHSLSKDITGPESIQQGHAIRCLCTLLDANNVLALERFLKQAILSETAYTASAALCGALTILKGGKKDVVMRWLPEIKQASKGNHRSVRFHALQLLYALKADDVHASAQLANTLENTKSQLERCVSVAIAANSMKTKPTDQVQSLLKNAISSAPVLVKLEAVRRCSKEFPSESMEFLSTMLRSGTIRAFAAVRTIMMVDSLPGSDELLPQILDLMKHPNSSLAAMAAICVLRLGDESYVEIATKRIVKNCRKWQTPLVKAVAEEACKFAGKFKNDKLTDVAVLLMRIAGDKRSKFSILRALLTTEGIPRAQLLPRLSEYLEDWDSVSIARTICDFICSQVSELEDPMSIVPVLYNRVTLDVTSVRLAALNTLAAIGAGREETKEAIITLLSIFRDDEDDIVREEVLLLLDSLQNGLELELTPFTMEQADDNTQTTKAEAEEVEETTTAATFVPVEMNPVFEKYGKLLWKTDAIELTERDTEFVVSYFVNVFEEHIILEFICTNTVEDSVYNDLSIQLEDADVVEATSAESISYQQTVLMSVVIERTEEMFSGSFGATLLYTPEDDGVEDEYELGNVVLDASIYLTPAKVTDFDAAIADTSLLEQSSVFAMTKEKSPLKAARRVESEIIRLEKIDEEKGQRKIVIRFAGRDRKSGGIVLVKAEVGSSKKQGVLCRVTVWAGSEDLCTSVMSSFNF